MKFVSYLRTSTRDQRLGIEAQREKATAYAAAQGGQIVAEFEEHESGKDDQRPQLAQAIAECKRQGATLLIAKLDRLSRRVAFLFQLKEQLDAKGLQAVCVDMPEIMQSTIMLGIMASLAQQERELISERTRAALAAKKAQGFKLGRPKGSNMDEAVKASLAKRMQSARKWAQKHIGAIQIMMDSGMSLNKIAAALNAQGISTRRGGAWSATTVKRVISASTSNEA